MDYDIKLKKIFSLNQLNKRLQCKSILPHQTDFTLETGLHMAFTSEDMPGMVWHMPNDSHFSAFCTKPSDLCLPTKPNIVGMPRDRNKGQVKTDHRQHLYLTLF